MNGAKLIVLINQLSLLVACDAKNVFVSQDRGKVALHIGSRKAFPPDVVQFGTRLGFTYIPYSATPSESELNCARFVWEPV